MVLGNMYPQILDESRYFFSAASVTSCVVTTMQSMVVTTVVEGYLGSRVYFGEHNDFAVRNVFRSSKKAVIAVHHVTSYGETWQAQEACLSFAYNALLWFEHFRSIE
jgi:hypothetical protein